MEECIFLNRPRECGLCIRGQKLQCLLNKRHLIVSEAGAAELREILEEAVHDPERYKAVPGQEGREMFLRGSDQ